MSKVYVVNELVDLGSHIVKIFDDLEKAKSFTNKEIERLEKKYWEGFSDDIYGNKKVFISEHVVF